MPLAFDERHYRKHSYKKCYSIYIMLAKTYVHKITSRSLLSGLMSHIFLISLCKVSLEELVWLYFMKTFVSVSYFVLFLRHYFTKCATTSKDFSGCHLKYFMWLTSGESLFTLGWIFFKYCKNRSSKLYPFWFSVSTENAWKLI